MNEAQSAQSAWTAWWCPDCGRQLLGQGFSHSCKDGELSRKAEPVEVVPASRLEITDEEIARMFHEAYERLAPDFGYKTREASAVPWDDGPEANKRLMVAVAREVRAALSAALGGGS